MSFKCIFQGFWPQAQNSYSVKQISMVDSDILYWRKNNIFFFKNIWSAQKKLSTPLFIPFLKYQIMNIFFKRFVGDSL